MFQLILLFFLLCPAQGMQTKKNQLLVSGSKSSHHSLRSSVLESSRNENEDEDSDDDDSDGDDDDDESEYEYNSEDDDDDEDTRSHCVLNDMSHRNKRTKYPHGPRSGWRRKLHRQTERQQRNLNQ